MGSRSASVLGEEVGVGGMGVGGMGVGFNIAESGATNFIAATGLGARGAERN